MKKVLNILLLTGTLAKSGNQARLERMMRNNENASESLVQSTTEEQVEARSNVENQTDEASIAETMEKEVAEDISQNNNIMKQSLLKKAEKL